MNILCFKLEKVEDPFCMGKVSDEVEKGLQKYPIDWTDNLSDTFNKQVKNNFIDVMNYCQYQKVVLDNGIILSDKEKQEGLIRFEKRRGDYLFRI